MNHQFKDASDVYGWIYWGLVLILVILGVFYFKSHFLTKSNAQNYAACTHDANKLYDLERQRITENVNGYSSQEQAVYYQRTDIAYADQLQSCRQSYAQ